jgi:predicted acetyltransferase
MLYPFSPAFYRAHGWAPAVRTVRWRFRPSELPLYTERAQVVRLSMKDPAHRAEVQAVYHRHCALQNGSLSRSDAWLEYQYGDERWHVVGVRAGGELTGYLSYKVRTPSPRPQILVAPELIALDDTAQRALIGFLAAQAEQIDVVHLDTSIEDPLGMILDQGIPPAEDGHEPGGQVEAGTVYTGAMARIVDLAAALAGRGYPGGDGVVCVHARDALVAENGAQVTAVVERGAARVNAGRAPGAPLLSGEIADVTRVLTGALRLRDALRHGLVTLDGGDAGRLDALLALPAPYPLMSF